MHCKNLDKNKINSILEKEDIEGLIEAGAPKDEYSSEAEDIAKALQGFNTEELTQDNVLKILLAIWTKNFGLEKDDLERRLPTLILTAQKISKL